MCVCVCSPATHSLIFVGMLMFSIYSSLNNCNTTSLAMMTIAVHDSVSDEQ